MHFLALLLAILAYLLEVRAGGNLYDVLCMSNATSSVRDGSTRHRHVKSIYHSGNATIVRTPGLVILGMHRSGTSTIAGLINRMGLKTGGPLMVADQYNEKGYFERIDVANQNDIFFKSQDMHFSYNTYRYDSVRTLKDIGKPDGLNFTEGCSGLNFLNNPANYHWVLKDPRLCITLGTWLALISAPPAVLFTYRHPMDVALSLFHRVEHFPFAKSLRMWYVYNKMAIRQSQHLCRLVSSYRSIMANPAQELTKLTEGLRACGIPLTKRLTQEEINDFVDPKLQHGKNGAANSPCAQPGNTNTTKVPDASLPTVWVDPQLYQEVLRAYCAMEDGSAFKADYKWDDSIQDLPDPGPAPAPAPTAPVVPAPPTGKKHDKKTKWRAQKHSNSPGSWLEGVI